MDHLTEVRCQRCKNLICWTDADRDLCGTAIGLYCFRCATAEEREWQAKRDDETRQNDLDATSKGDTYCGPYFEVKACWNTFFTFLVPVPDYREPLGLVIAERDGWLGKCSLDGAWRACESQAHARGFARMTLDDVERAYNVAQQLNPHDPAE